MIIYIQYCIIFEEELKMKQSAVKIRHGFALAIRIIITVAITVLIIWKYNDLRHINIERLMSNASSSITAIAAVLGVYMVKGVTFVIPASLLYIAVGMALDTWKALIINFTGIILEFSVSYLLGIILGGNFVKKKIRDSKYGDKILNIYDKYENAGIVITRIILFPVDLNSVFLGSLRTPFLKYMGLSLLGIAPRVILYTVLGNKIYEYIPYKYLLPAAAILLIAGLIIWTVLYAVRSSKAEDSIKESPYSPLCKEKRSVILDTDMGPDCDDAGALAIMLKYLKMYDIELKGIFNCTSNPYANGCIRAICDYYGYEDVKIGQHKGREILPDCFAYNKPLVKKFCKFENSACSADESRELYHKILKGSADSSVTVISIGTFTNLAEIIEYDTALFNKKVHSVVSMAGEFPSGKEFNIKTDPIAFASFIEKFRNQIIFSGFETGKDILTGFSEYDEDNPVSYAYKEFCKSGKPYLRESWDLTAVQFAFEGETSFYKLSSPVEIKVNSSGEIKTKKNRYSNRYYIIRTADNNLTADYLNDLLEKRDQI